MELELPPLTTLKQLHEENDSFGALKNVGA